MSIVSKDKLVDLNRTVIINLNWLHIFLLLGDITFTLWRHWFRREIVGFVDWRYFVVIKDCVWTIFLNIDEMSTIDDFIHSTLELNNIIFFQDQSSLLAHVKIYNSSAITNCTFQVSYILRLSRIHDVHCENFANEGLVVIPRLELIDSERYILITIIGILMVILRLILRLLLLLLLLMISRILFILIWMMLLFLVVMLVFAIVFLMELLRLRIFLSFMNSKNIWYLWFLFFIRIFRCWDVEITNRTNSVIRSKCDVATVIESSNKIISGIEAKYHITAKINLSCIEIIKDIFWDLFSAGFDFCFDTSSAVS